MGTYLAVRVHIGEGAGAAGGGTLHGGAGEGGGGVQGGVAQQPELKLQTIHLQQSVFTITSNYGHVPN